MKWFIYLFLIVAIVFGLFILGNMLRCMTARGDVCPGWCYPKKIKCLTSECENKVACQAPTSLDYIALTSRFVEDQQTKWQKK